MMLRPFEFNLVKKIKQAFTSSSLEEEKRAQDPISFLLLVSGGRDSMALLNSFIQISSFQKKLGLSLKFAVQHFNHQKRGLESDEDEALVRKVCEIHQIPYFVEQWEKDNPLIDAPHFLEEEDRLSPSLKSSNFQNSARLWRYRKANELCDKEEAKQSSKSSWVIVTAHHARDHVESVLLHILRGSGVQGLEGFSLLENRIFRPFWDISYEEIVAYQEETNLSYREDSSNHSDDYMRNLLRHKVFPVFEKINPSYQKKFIDLSAHIKDSSLSAEILSLAKTQGQELSSLLSKNILMNLAHEIFLAEKIKNKFFQKELSLQKGWSFLISKEPKEPVSFKFVRKNG